MKSEFQTMTMRELKKYVLEHRQDLEAFQALMERVNSQPQGQVYSEADIEDFPALLKQHRRRED